MVTRPGDVTHGEVWLAVLERRLAPLASGDAIDIVDVTAELAGATACALLRLDADPGQIARAARDVAATAARTETPGLRRPADARAAIAATADFTDLLQADPAPADPAPADPAPADPAQADPAPADPAPADPAQADLLRADPTQAGLAAMLTLAAVNTTVAGIPRAVAWCADAGLWAAALDDSARPILVDELLRVIAPTPLLPRVAAEAGLIDGCPVHAGDRLVLIARHAAGAHRRGPDCADPAPRQLSQLVFGVGPHACPGARLARAQLDDVLRLLAPWRPVVVAARADRRAALPGWASLLVRPGSRPA